MNAYSTFLQIQILARNTPRDRDSGSSFIWHFLLQFFQILLPISYQARIVSRDYTHREQSLEACIRQEGPPCSGLSTSSPGPAPSAPNACGIPFALRSLRFTDKEFLAFDESPLMFLIMHHGCLVMSLHAHAGAHLTGSQRNTLSAALCASQRNPWCVAKMCGRILMIMACKTCTNQADPAPSSPRGRHSTRACTCVHDI